MDAATAQQTLDKIIGQIFGYQNPYTLEQFMQKYAFDIRLPQQVYDSTDNSQTWAQSTNPTRFIRFDNAMKRAEVDDWIIPKRPINSLQDILTAWNEVNLTATERQLDSHNIAESDNIYSSEYVYRSLDVHRSKYVLFSDAAIDSEYVACSQRSNSSSFCIRLEDSKLCSNSFEISWSGNITNSFFIHDSKDVSDSMFCSHISNKRFCIANMQFEEAEYMQLRQQVIQWILSPAS